MSTYTVISYNDANDQLLGQFYRLLRTRKTIANTILGDFQNDGFSVEVDHFITKITCFGETKFPKRFETFDFSSGRGGAKIPTVCNKPANGLKSIICKATLMGENLR